MTKLSLAGIFATGCSSAHRFDLVLSAGKVLTLDSASASATAVAIGNGRIVAVGDSSPVSDAGSDARVVRLDGAVVAPALIDHHVHLFNVGLALLNDRDHVRLLLDLGGVTSLEEIARRIEVRTRTALSGAWIVGGGWSQAAWGTQALPTSEVLNAAAPGHHGRDDRSVRGTIIFSGNPLTTPRDSLAGIKVVATGSGRLTLSPPVLTAPLPLP